jgi:hypothetical protein
MAARATAPPSGHPPPSPQDRQLSDRLTQAIEATERNWPWALGALMLLSGALLMYMGRKLTFFYDDWDFVTHDYGGGFHSLMQAHVGNISVFPVAVYKVLFHLVGLNHYAVFRFDVVVLHLISGGLIFVLAARRVPRVPSLLATALILFLGAAWEDLLWGFQVGYMLSVAGGLATWVLLERNDRLGDLAAMACLTIAAGSSSLGIALMVGVAAELLWRKQDRKRVWVVVIPAILYALWYLSYGESQVTENNLIAAPGYFADLIAAAFGALIGRGLDWGRPLAVAGVLVLLAGYLVRARPASARLVGLLATGIVLWSITAAARSTISSAESSRYVYMGAVVIVLVSVELLRGVTLTSRIVGLATAFVAFAALSGLTVLHAGAVGRRENAEVLTAELGALELAAAHAPPTYQPDAERAPQIMAGPYLHTVRAMHSSPADTPAEITAAGPTARAAADGVLLALDGPALQPLGTVKPSPLAPAPSLTEINGGTVSQHAACVQLLPLHATSMTATLTLPSSGVAIYNEGTAPATLGLKRFGDSYVPLATPAASHSAGVLSLPTDSAPNRWQLQATASTPLSVCGLSP